jgi:hypothetical protein
MADEKPEEKESKNPKGFAIAALILGIAAFLLGWVPFLGFFMGALAIVFAILSLIRKQPKGLNITGLVLGVVGAATSTLVLFLLVIAGSIPTTSTSNTQASSEQENSTQEPIEEPQEETLEETDSPSQSSNLKSLDEWEKSMESKGWTQSPQDESVWFQFADSSTYTCDYYTCAYLFVVVSEDCYNGVLLEAVIKDGNLQVGYDTRTTSSLVLDGNKVPSARVEFIDLTQTGDSFVLNQAYCMD